MSWPISWFKADYGDLTQRFVYADGAPFDGHMDSPRAFMRALKSPTTLYHAIACAFVGAAVALCAPGALGAVAFAAFCFEVPAYNVMTQRHILREHWKEHPSLRNVLIDKTGRAQNDPKAFARVDNYYQEEIARTKSFLLGCTPIAIAAFTGTAVAVGAPLLMAFGAATFMVAGLAMPPFALRLAWTVHARKQLHRTDKPWTVTTDPPPVRRKAPSLARRRQLALAAIPARARGL
jgi:hypothetical protein